MKKKISSILTFVMMLVGMFVLKENNVAYGAEGTLRINEDAYDMSSDQSGEGWEYSASDSTLKLTDFNGSYIYASSQLSIIISGNNVINSTDDYDYGIRVDDANLYLSGSESEECTLTINMENRTDASDYKAIACYDLSSSNVDISINLSNKSSNGAMYGISTKSSTGKTTIFSGSLSIVNTGEDDDNDIFRAVYSHFTKYGTGDIYIDMGNGERVSGFTFSTEIGGSGETTVIARNAMNRGLSVTGYNTGKITIQGYMYLGYSGKFDFASNRDFVEPKECVLYNDFFYDPVTMEKEDYFVIDAVESKPFKMVDSELWDLKELTMGEEIKSIDLSGGVFPIESIYYYGFKVKEGYSLPQGITLTGEGIISGTPTLEYESQDVVLTLSYKGETIEFTIHIDEVYDPYPITEVTLNKNEIFANVGHKETLISGITPSNAINTNKSFVSSNPEIVTVDATTGAIEAIATGKATITVTTESRKKTATCTVYVKEVMPKPQWENCYITGLVANASYKINGINKVANVDGKIAIEPAWVNTVVNIVKINEESKCNSDIFELDLTGAKAGIESKKDKTTVVGNCTYNGKAHVITIEGLVEGTDYKVTYANNINAGTATATITGLGVYVGSFTIDFTISPAVMSGIKASDINKIYNGRPQQMPLDKYPEGATVTYSRTKNGKYGKSIPCIENVGKEVVYYKVEMANYVTVTGSYKISILPAKIDGLKISLKKDTFVYNGKKNVPDVVVTDKSGRIVDAIKCKVRLLTDGKSVGKQRLVVEISGNYKGSKNLSFVINPKPTKFKNIKTTKTTAIIKWNKISKQTKGYQLQISKKDNFKSKNTFTIKNNKITSTIIRKLTAGKKYYVRIRTYKVVNGKNYYSEWSQIKGIRTKK